MLRGGVVLGDDSPPLDTVRAALEASGHEVRNGRARCPAHDDSTPSLSINASPEGHALIHCHAGCAAGDVLAALGLEMGDLFPDGPAGRNGSRPVPTRHRYIGADGAVIVDVLVTRGGGGPKRYRRAPEGVSSIDTPLYHLPEVLAAIAEDRKIFVVEGEKCADAIHRAGGVATTNAGGAGKWLPHHTATLAGAASVTVIADADRPGIAHARAVVASLHSAGVESVRPVLPRHRPNNVSGYDIADQLAAGLDLDDLEELEELDDLDELTIDSPGRWVTLLAPSLVDWAELWATDTLESDWLLEPLVARGRAHALYAPAKAGKSLLMLEAAAAMATGRPWLDQPGGTPRSVLYLDMEMTADDLRDRLSDFGYGPDDDLGNLHYHLLPSLPPLDHPDGGAACLELIAHYCPELVVVDTLGRVVSGPENDSDTYRAFFQYTGSAVKRVGAALVRLDHAGKDLALGQRGSSGKSDDVDVVWRLTVGDGDGLTLKCTHRRMAWVPLEVPLQRRADPLRHVRSDGSWPPGTAEMAGHLATLGVPVGASRRSAEPALRGAGHKVRTEVLGAALRYRRTLPEEPVS